MDHEAVRETLELAAAEPGGLDRLMAGDTPTAIAVAMHLAGCEACTSELERLRRVSGLVRDVVSTTLPPDLRARTLAHVRTHGVPRGAPVVAQGVPEAGPSPVRSSMPVPIVRPSRRPIFGWFAAVAAAVAISVAATTFLVGSRFDDRLTAQDEAIHDLASVTTATLRVSSAADVARVALDSPTHADVTGTLIYSPSTTELVVVATGLTEPAAGMEYRCWLDRGDGRKGVGKMFFGGGLAYWVGPSPAVAGSTGPLRFGVSLVGADGADIGPDPVLVGAS